MDKISTFTIKEHSVDLLYHNGFLAYSLDFNGKPYGNKVKLTSRKVLDVASATFLLLTNAFETLEALQNDIPGTGDGA